MSKCNCTTVYIQFAKVKSKVTTYCYRLCCKCLVCLNQIKVINAHACFSKNLLCRSDRSNTHDFWIHTAKSTGYKCCHWCYTKLFCFFFAHYYNRSCTIINTGSVTSCYHTAFFTGAASKTAKALSCCTRTWSLIGIKYDCFLFRFDFNRNNLIFEFTCSDSSFTFLLAVSRELIQLFTSNSVLLCYVLSSNHHVILIESIPQCIVYHGIHKFTIVHTVTKTSIHSCVRSHGHVLHTTGNNDISISCLNHLSCHIYTVQTGTTNNVYGNCCCLDWKTSTDGCLTSYVLTKTCLDYTSHVNMVNGILWHACSLKSLLNNDRT